MAIKHLKQIERLFDKYKSEVDAIKQEVCEVLGDSATLDNSIINSIEDFNGLYQALMIALGHPEQMNTICANAYTAFLDTTEDYVVCMQEKLDEKIVDQSRALMNNYKATFYILATIDYYLKMPKRKRKLPWYNKEYSKLNEDVWNSVYLLSPMDEYLDLLVQDIRKEKEELIK